MKKHRKISAVIGLGLTAISLSVFAEVPKGWFISGTAPAESYEVGIDRAAQHKGHNSVAIKSKTSTVSGFYGLGQMIAADDYRKKRVRLSGNLKTSLSAGRGQMWFRVDGPEGKSLGFDNMDSRPVTGNSEWTRCDIVLDVPQESVALAYGFFSSGGVGTVWGAGFRLEQVGTDVPLTGIKHDMPKQPTNMDFNQD